MEVTYSKLTHIFISYISMHYISFEIFLSHKLFCYILKLCIFMLLI
jgi:hypothetical protein